MRTPLFTAAGLAALLATAPAPAFAFEAPEATDVDEVVVTIARLPTTPADAPGVRVVDAAEIEALQATFADDVLVTVPGVSLYSEGAFGGITSVRIRGASTDKTLVLVDGVPVNDPASPSGAYDFSSLDLADVGRIEILSGPQGSLWGSAAIGGVISFTTREPDGLSAQLEGGSFNTLRSHVSVGVRDADHALFASVSSFRTDGVSQADEADGNPERDGFETWTAGVGGRARLAPAVEVDGRVRYTASDADTDGFPPPLFLLADTADRAQKQTWSGYGRARIEGPWAVDHTLSVSLYDLERDSFGSFPGHFTADRQVYRWVAEHDRPQDRWGLVGGVEHERVRGDASFADARLSTTSVFAVGRFDLSDRLTATLGLRNDAPDAFDGKTTVRATLAANLGGGWRATASFGQGFKTPTISQFLCDFCFAPPVPLRPETAQGWDATIGWRSAGRRLQGSLTGYRLEVEDQIAYVAGRYINIASTSADGIEADLQAELPLGLRLKAGYAWTHAVDDATGGRLLRAPEHTGSATLFWAHGRFDAALTARGESEQLDVVGFGTGVRPGFVTADLAMGYALTERVRMTARIENLTDRRYQEAAGYGEPGLSGYVGLRLRY
jgi:vitamin B12 transporter